MNYRADIDGLRAVAVLAVIANHLPGSYLSSGFLGVDVFFVISGFVITASILSQNPSSFIDLYSIKDCSVTNREACAARRVDLIRKNSPILKQLYSISASYNNLHVFDPFSVFCPDTQNWCYPDEKDIFLYFDLSHLNSVGSRKMAQPFTSFLRDRGLLGAH